MNKETLAIQTYIDLSEVYLDKVMELKQKFTNSKDFFNQLGYIVQDIVNKEKKFMNMSRKNIDLPILAEIYFGGNYER